MERATFDTVMREVFVPYVQTQRELCGLPKEAPSVLVVDGHSSRYNPSTLHYLRQNHIHLLVIPAHSSHILQPLDLTLNRLVKDRYKEEYPLAESRFLKEKNKKHNGIVDEEDEEETTPQPPESAESCLLKEKNKKQKGTVVEETTPQPKKNKKQKAKSLPKKNEKQKATSQPKKNEKQKATSQPKKNKKRKDTVDEEETTPQPPESKRGKMEQFNPVVTAEESDYSANTETEEDDEVLSDLEEGDEVQAVPEDNKNQPSGLTLAERRAVMIEAAVNAVMSSLIHRNIKSAWEASGLFPLLEHPPYSRKKAEKLKNQAVEMGVYPNQKKNVVHLTGVLTDDDQLRDIENLIEKRGKIKGKGYSYRRTVMTILGERVKEYIVCKSLADVGDYAYLDDGDFPESQQQSGESQQQTGVVSAEQIKTPPKRGPGRPKRQWQNTFNTGDIISWLTVKQPKEVAQLDITELGTGRTVCKKTS